MIFPIKILLLIIAGILQGEQETIQRNPAKSWFPKWKWWINNNWQYKNKYIQWLMRYPLSIFKDGWHFCKGVTVICLLILIAGNWYMTIIYYAILGMAFNMSYHN